MLQSPAGSKLQGSCRLLQIAGCSIAGVSIAGVADKLAGSLAHRQGAYSSDDAAQRQQQQAEVSSRAGRTWRR